MTQLDDLYRNYKVRIESFIRHMVRDAVLAQDLTQETFIHAQKGLKDFRGGQPFLPGFSELLITSASIT